MPLKKKLDLSIEVDVLTAGTASDIINAILETLLFQRNQIPFVYKTYRYYVNKWQEQEDKQSNDENFVLQNFQAERKKKQATDTKEAISSMRQVIRKVIERSPIKCLRFLFGPTIFTAKEAYTLHIPTENIAVNHFHEHHQISPNNLSKTLLSLLTSEDLYTVFSSNLNPTNVYLELELLESEELKFSEGPLQHSEIFPKEFSSLPASCKDIHIHLLYKQCQTTNNEQLTCCKELQVYEDFMNLNLEGKTEETRISNTTSKQKLTNLTSVWCEAEIFVRGFKDQQIKGLNIWN